MYYSRGVAQPFASAKEATFLVCFVAARFCVRISLQIPCKLPMNSVRALQSRLLWLNLLRSGKKKTPTTTTTKELLSNLSFSLLRPKLFAYLWGLNLVVTCHELAILGCAWKLHIVGSVTKTRSVSVIKTQIEAVSECFLFPSRLLKQVLWTAKSFPPWFK